MKLIKTILTLAIFATTSAALASGPVLDAGVHNGSCIAPAVCMSLYKYNGITTLHVAYEGSILSYPLTAGVLINGNFIGNVSLTRATGEGQQDGGFIALNGSENGDLAVYFFDQNGNYDSNYSENYHFTLEQ